MTTLKELSQQYHTSKGNCIFNFSPSYLRKFKTGYIGFHTISHPPHLCWKTVCWGIQSGLVHPWHQLKLRKHTNGMSPSLSIYILPLFHFLLPLPGTLKGRGHTERKKKCGREENGPNWKRVWHVTMWGEGAASSRRLLGPVLNMTGKGCWLWPYVQLQFTNNEKITIWNKVDPC